MSPVGTRYTFVESMNRKWPGRVVVSSDRNRTKVLGPNFTTLDDVYTGKLHLNETRLVDF